MDSRDRNAISDLFRKLQDVERQAGPRDAEAERLIADETQRLPGAPYYMAQTIVMQDMALNAKHQEVEDLKRRLGDGNDRRDQPAESGGFLSRMFGGGSTAGAAAPRATQGGPWGGQNQQPAGGYAPQGGQGQYAPPQQGYGRGFGGGGGGFLAGAAQTAMGVAGGVVLGTALGNMFAGNGFGFGNDEQQTAETDAAANDGEAAEPAADATDAGADDAGYQDASYDDAGGDFGGMEDV